ncbi:MAG: argininosuccinate lyase [Deltaproteobacteria bacterium]|nr:argininosuccinate lyase [Deltaproteobacteria bacterium]MBW1915329.1 argininosuccinate lyase [Deltaproteobacteria bacterium]
MSKKLWGGRFKESINDLVDRFNESLSFDRRLYAQDIRGSIAHSRMLAKQGIISDNDASRIIDGLTEAKREMDRKNHLDSDLEDVHSLIEKVLVAKVGAAGEKMHTARSRNDQVALDMRMYVRDAVTRVINLIKEMQRVLIDLAEKNIDLIMPGYTHLQPAQPVLVAHHLMAYYEMLKRDKQRFYEDLKRVNVLPLGSAALAGTTFDLDREMVADELGFDSISKNSMDAVSDRDFVIEYIFAGSVLMMHLSRLSEEMILWSTQEFGIINLPDAFCTGSSIMPQKKNPDILELIRGKTGRVYGHLISLLTVMKGLPLTYNKDMQEDKESLFDTVDTVEDCLSVITLLLKEVSFNGDTMKQACEKGYLMATDLADYMVVNGSTFRQAHDAVGKIVLYAIDNKKELHELKLEEMKQFSKHIKKDVFKWLEPASAIKRRNLLGGTGSRAVLECIKQAKMEINS